MLNGKDRRYLRGLGNPLKPVVWIGREGITPALIQAIDQAHAHQELIKLKILEPGGQDRRAIAAELDESTASEVVGMVGGAILLFRRNEENPRITLPSSND
jgi:RNA-binding protein